MLIFFFFIRLRVWRVTKFNRPSIIAHLFWKYSTQNIPLASSDVCCFWSRALMVALHLPSVELAQGPVKPYPKLAWLQFNDLRRMIGLVCPARFSNLLHSHASCMSKDTHIQEWRVPWPTEPFRLTDNSLGSLCLIQLVQNFCTAEVSDNCVEQFTTNTIDYIDYIVNVHSWLSVSGVPAITVPVTLSSNGLPIGLQLISRHFSEHKLLLIAKAVEQLVKFKPLDLSFLDSWQ